MTASERLVCWLRFRLRDGGWRCWFTHRWRVHQHCLRADDDVLIVFVIAWRQCDRCAKSKLMHVLR